MKKNIAKDMKTFYESSHKYHNLLKKPPKYFHTYIRFVKRNIKIKQPYVLEIGCGSGTSSKLLEKMGCNVMATDISKLFIKENKSTKHIHFKVEDVMNLTFPESTFDAVTSFNVIEHVPDVEKALSEMIRVTKKGGYIVIVSPNLLSPFVSLAALKQRLFGQKRRLMPDYQIFEIISKIFENTFKVLLKFFSKYKFQYQEPNLERAIGQDDDAVFISNPLDIKKYMAKKQFQLVSKSNSKGLRKLIPYYFLTTYYLCFKKL